jgi:uncharacterized protein YkwD
MRTPLLSRQIAVAASLIFLTGVVSEPAFAVPAKTKHWVYSLSQQQQNSDILKVWGVPACATVGTARPKGTYITGLTGDGLGLALCLQPGDVLLSINSRVISSAVDADRILKQMKAGKVKAVVARMQGGRVILLQPSANYGGGMSAPDSPNVSTASSSVDVTTNMRSEGHGTYSSHYQARGNVKKEALSDSEIASLESGMVSIINADRQKNGQSQLRQSSQLSQVARAFAQDMARRNFFAHNDPDGRSPHDRALAAGLRCRVFENIAYHIGPLGWGEMVKGAEDEMMAEPPNDPHNHRGNILNPNHAVVGVGVAIVMPNKLFVVQEFSTDEVP